MTKGLVIHAAAFNVSAPGANTDILATAITPKEGGALHITVVLSTASVFNFTVTDGTTTHTISFNSGLSLNANQVFTFTIGCNRQETNSGSANTLSYNFQVATDSVIEYLVIDEGQLGTS